MNRSDATLTLGVDLGSTAIKAVLLADGMTVKACRVALTGHNARQSAEQLVAALLDEAGVTPDQVARTVATGYGRLYYDPADREVSEITCHARGTRLVMPQARTIVDIGGQDSKAIQVDVNGNVSDFVMNDKCAAGTGRFLEVMATVLEAGSVENMGPLSLKGSDPCSISSTCTIFAESEVVSLRAEGRSREDLIAGVHRAVASRVAVMARRLDILPALIFTGGVAKNIGVRKALEEEFGLEIVIPEEPQVMGALGAALMAAEHAGVHLARPDAGEFAVKAGRRSEHGPPLGRPPQPA